MKVCEVCRGERYVTIDFGFGEYGNQGQIGHMPCNNCNPTTGIIGVAADQVIDIYEEKIAKLKEELAEQKKYFTDWMVSIANQVNKLSHKTETEWEDDE